MEGKKGIFWRAVRPYIATVVGVGIFGLPLAVAQVGVGPGIVVLAVVGALNAVMLVMYAELLVARRNHDRFAAVIGRELGVAGEMLGACALLAVLWGAMLAYLVAGGAFLSEVLLAAGVELGRTVAVVPLWAMASLLAFGGLGVVTTAQKYLVPLAIGVITLLVVMAAPHVEIANVGAMGVEPWWALVPVALFSFSGIAAIAEMRDLVQGRGMVLNWAIGVGAFLVWLVYAAFVFAIVGVTGAETTERAVNGLQLVVPGFALLGAGLGLVTTFTAFVAVATSVLDTLFYDFRLTHLQAWAWAVLVPFGLFLLGARELLAILQFVGGVFGGLLGIFVLIAYEKARFSGDLPKNTLMVPSILVFTVFMLFGSAVLTSLWQIII